MDGDNLEDVESSSRLKRSGPVLPINAITKNTSSGRMVSEALNTGGAMGRTGGSGNLTMDFSYGRADDTELGYTWGDRARERQDPSIRKAEPKCVKAQCDMFRVVERRQLQRLLINHLHPEVRAVDVVKWMGRVPADFEIVRFKTKNMEYYSSFVITTEQRNFELFNNLENDQGGLL